MLLYSCTLVIHHSSFSILVRYGSEDSPYLSVLEGTGLNFNDLGSGALVLVFGTCFSVPAENQFPYLGCFAVLFENVWQIDDLLHIYIFIP